MKDAFGGTYMLYVLMIFFVIYISFMTVAIGYAKAFRIKNHIVSVLEKPVYYNNLDNALEELQGNDMDGNIGYLREVSYNYSSESNPTGRIYKDCVSRESNTENRKVLNEGVCIIKKCSDYDSDGKCTTDSSYYYEVTSYFIIEAPFFKISFVVPIRGETKLLNL